VFIHPASVNNRKHEAKTDESGAFYDKQLFAFAEKVRNVSAPGSSNAQTFIKGNTKLDPMTYLLFGAYNLVVTDRGLECDGWLPIVGPVDVLDDVQRLKTLMDECILRVFEGIEHRRREQKLYPSSRVPAGLLRSRQEESDEDEGDDDSYAVSKTRSRALSEEEIREFDYLTRDVVRVLDRFAEERSNSMSRFPSRPGTPRTAFNSGRNTPINAWTPSGGRLTLPPSGYSTPYSYGSAHSSRPVTPSGLTRTTNPW
jgi:small subunit ribosomal protein S24e